MSLFLGNGIILSQTGCWPGLFYYSLNCNGEGQKPVYSNQSPHDYNCKHWPVLDGNVTHIAYFQDNLSINFPPSEVCYYFDVTEAKAAIQRAMSIWAKQCCVLDDRRLIWATTENGGNFRWNIFDEGRGDINNGTFNKYLKPSSAGIAVWAVKNENNLNHYVPYSQCAGDFLLNSSQVIINNSMQFRFYLSEKKFKWTTDPSKCFTEYNNEYGFFELKCIVNGVKYTCIDFQSLALHEIGHYLGLSHLDFISGNVMRGNSVTAYWSGLHDCNADHFRKLYCPECIGLPASIDPWFLENILNIELKVHPSPYSSGDFFINFNLPVDGEVEIQIINTNGQSVNILKNYFSKSEYSIPVNVTEFSSGAYILSVYYKNRFHKTKFIIAR